MSKSHAPIALAAALLLLQLFLRVHDNTRQDPYIDEGFHIVRASIAWDFDQNPGRFAHGKMLLYFWMGLFRPTHDTGLFVGRTSVALFSLLTGAAIFATARRLFGSGTGLVALGLYAVLPLSFFYERMAMADPLAAGFAALIAWRGLIFARRPTLRQGAILGVLIALATMSKLTMGLMPLLPVVAALLYGRMPGESWRDKARTWLNTVVPPLAVAAGVAVLIWSPILIPAWIANHTDHPFVLVDPFNLRSSAEEPDAPDTYLEGALPLIEDMTGEGLLIALGIALVVLLLLSPGITRRGTGYVLAWLLLVALLPTAAARLITLRYFMAASGPVAILLGRFAVVVWQGIRPDWRAFRLMRWPLRTGIGLAAGAWLGLFAIPFIHTDITAPLDLALHGTNRTEYISGFLSADDGVRAGAQTINTLPRDKPLYVNWSLCHMWYFYTDHAMDCIGLERPMGELVDYLNRDLRQPGDFAYLALTGYKPFFQNISGLCWEEVASHDRPRITRPVGIWKLWKPPC